MQADLGQNARPGPSDMDRLDVIDSDAAAAAAPAPGSDGGYQPEVTQPSPTSLPKSSAAMAPHDRQPYQDPPYPPIFVGILGNSAEISADCWSNRRNCAA